MTEPYMPTRKQSVRDSQILEAIRALGRDEELRSHIVILDKALQSRSHTDLWATSRHVASSAMCGRCENIGAGCWDCSGTGVDPIPFAEVLSSLRKEV